MWSPSWLGLVAISCSCPTQRSLLPLDDTQSVAASLSQFQRSHLTAAGSSHSSDQTSWQGPKGSSASAIIRGALMRLHLDAPFIVIPNIAPPSDVAEGFYLGSQATQSQTGQGFVGVRALVPWRDRTFLRGGHPPGHHLLSGDHHSRRVPVQLGCSVAWQAGSRAVGCPRPHTSHQRVRATGCPFSPQAL